MAKKITEHKRAEEALRYSEARYRALHRDIPTMIFTLDTEGKVLSVNPYGASQLGYTIQELEGEPVLNVFHPDDRQAVSEQLLECLENPGRVYRWQLRKIHKSGAILWVEELAQAVNDLNGVPNVLVVCRDVTERKQAEEALRKAHCELEQKVVERTRELSEANAKLMELDRLKSMFIASMSHELRTPLNTIIGFASILLKEWSGSLSSEQKENAAAILRAGMLLLALVNDVIDVSKIEAGKIDSLVEEFDLPDLVEEAVDFIKEAAREKGLTLQVEVFHRQMATDKRRLLQCLVNLLTNAVKFTEKGTVTIRVADSAPQEGSPPEGSDWLAITVTDTGTGIRQEDLPRLFKPFERVVSPKTASVPGTGLGLYLTRRLVTEVLKGDISCASDHGRGSAFTIRIPARISNNL